MVACGPIADDREWDIVGDFSEVEVRLSNGDLRIEGIDGDRVEVDTDFGGVARHGSVSRYVEDDALVIDYDCALCGGDLAIGVPRWMPLRASLDHGDLGIDGMSGDVFAEVHTGSIGASELGGAFDALAHAGGIEVEFDTRPTDVRAESRIGAVLVEVPRGPYFIDASATFGVVQLTNVSHDRDSDEAIDVVAHAGEVRIVGQ